MTSERNSCLSPRPPTLSLGLVACTEIIRHGGGGRKMSVSDRRKGFRRVTEVKDEGKGHFFCSASQTGVRVERCASTLPV